MAQETDAARDRVIAARAELAGELQVLEASTRAAVDIPARVKRAPGKAAAVAGGIGFLALKGPQRLFRAGKRAVRGPAAPMPTSMLPDEIEKTLRALGSDGDRVRGALERDFADYAKAATKERAGLRRTVLMAAAVPLLRRGATSAADWLGRPDEAGFSARLKEVRERAEVELEKVREAAAAKGSAKDDDATDAGA